MGAILEGILMGFGLIMIVLMIAGLVIGAIKDHLREKRWRKENGL